MRDLLRTGTATALVVLIMFIGSLVLWIGTPLLWLWVGSQVQGATSSLGAALGTMFIGVIATIAVLASVLAKLSNVYRANCQARGNDDPGHSVLEGVLVVSAGFTAAAEASPSAIRRFSSARASRTSCARSRARNRCGPGVLMRVSVISLSLSLHRACAAAPGAALVFTDATACGRVWAAATDG